MAILNKRKLWMMLLVTSVSSFYCENLLADFVHFDQTALLAQSECIVEGQYLGEQTITLEHKNFLLGVIKIQQTIKGTHRDIILIKRPMFAASDNIEVKQGQSGWWFFRQDKTADNLFVIEHPQRFIPNSEIGDILRLLKTNK